MVPTPRMCALVPACDEEQAHYQLHPWSEVKVVPVSTAHGNALPMLLVLADILCDCPQAEIVVVSADSYIANPEPFLQALLMARDRLALVPAVVVGATVSHPVAGTQWLMPGNKLGEGIFSFSEAINPSSEEECRQLRTRGAMWNTSSFIARGRFLWQILAHEMSAHAGAIAQLWRAGSPSSEAVERVLDDASQSGPALDVGDALLKQCGSIAITRVDQSGWNDWGSPEKVLHSLPSVFERDWLLSRLASAAPPTVRSHKTRPSKAPEILLPRIRSRSERRSPALRLVRATRTQD